MWSFHVVPNKCPSLNRSVSAAAVGPGTALVKPGLCLLAMQCEVPPSDVLLSSHPCPREGEKCWVRRLPPGAVPRPKARFGLPQMTRAVSDKGHTLDYKPESLTGGHQPLL